MENKRASPAVGTRGRLKTRLGASLDYWRGRAQGVPGPVELHVELTNRCNQACPMCPLQASPRPKGEMDLGLFTDLLDELKGHTTLVDLSLSGEPLLNRSAADFVAAAKNRDMVVYLQTNATCLDEGLSRDLISAGLDLITFSLDAARPATYAQVRPPGPPLDEVEERVRAFLGMARAGGRPFTMVQMVRLGKNREEEREFTARWRGLARGVKFKTFDDRAGLVDSRLGRGEWQGKAGGRCARLWRGMGLLWDGKAVPCCKDVHGREVLGNAFEEGPRALWNGPRMTGLRQLHARGQQDRVPLCRGCTEPSQGLFHTLAFTLADPSAVRKLAGLAGRWVPGR
jgi:radical SAM family protein/iron-sulfur cluster protein